MSTYEPDLTLARGIAAGDEPAFVSLVQSMSALLFRLAIGFVRTPAVAEEVVQETWLAVLEGIARFEGRSSLRTWIVQILANRARTRGTRENRSLPFSALDDEGDFAAVDPSRFDRRKHWRSIPPRWNNATPEKLAVDGEMRAHIEAAIAELPESQRAVITLRDVQGWNSEEVCNALTLSDTNERVLLHRARSRVRAALERYLDGK